MTFPLLAIAFGLALLVWSADRFVGGAASIARRYQVPSLLIGMVIIGFGTSLPEMLVSSLAAWQEQPGLALGNAYGSNITNIALILGVTALISPIAFKSLVLRKELPLLTAVTGLAAWQLHDGQVTRLEAAVLLAVFSGLMGWTIRQGRRKPSDPLGAEVESSLAVDPLTLRRAWVFLALGLVGMVAGSRALVWGAVGIARAFGVGDLVIGLTVVAVGTSLPELASSVAAARKKEHDLALGNILGSNLFNSLAVVGLAGLIRPLAAGPEVFHRDIPVMAALTVSLFVIGYGFGGPGRINRIEGLLLLACYVAYTIYLVAGAGG